MALFAQPSELDTTELSDTETTPAKNHQYNGTSPPLGTQPSSPHSPLIDALISTDEPPPHPRNEAVDTDHLACAEYLPKV